MNAATRIQIPGEGSSDVDDAQAHMHLKHH